MKKLFSIILVAAFVFGWGTASAQCNIVTPNTTPGFTPDPAPAITQGTAYNLSIQIYVPTSTTVSGITASIDSVHIDSIGNLPSHIVAAYNPTSKTVLGGGNGAICLSGTTQDTVGTYALVFYGNAYATALGQHQALPLNAAPVNTQFKYSLVVQAAQAQSNCDTLFNLSSVHDTATLYLADTTLTAGYISGNNEFGDLIKAEGFASVIGDYVNSALFYPAVVTINPADTNTLITIGVWDNTGTDIKGNAGAPGTMIDSTHVTLGQFAQAVTASTQGLVGLLVNFQGGVALSTDTFFVGVILPLIPGDTIALFQNTQFGVGGHGWEYEVNYVTQDGSDVWGSYDEDWGFTGAGNYIMADICPSPATGIPVASFTASPTTACANAPVTFTDGSSSAPAPSAWGWSFGDGSSSSNQNPSHAFATAGTYTVTEAVSNNLGGAIQAFVNATQTITVVASPTATAAVNDATSPSSANGSVVVTATGGTPAYTYAWSSGSSTTDSLGGVNPGTYTVTVTDANSCTVTASGSVYVTGILSLSNAVTVSIYPNPATDFLNLIWSQKVNAEVSVVDLNGNVISTLVTNGDMKTAFDIHSLAAGAYIVRVTDKSNNQQQSMLFSKF